MSFDKSLTAHQRAILFNHIDREVSVVVNRDTFVSTMKLIKRGLLRPKPKDRPRHTLLSAKGRELVCKLLAEHADALVAAGFDGVNEPSPQVRETLSALQLLRIMRSCPPAPRNDRFFPKTASEAAE
jgi:hypothetical protein